MLLWAKKEVYSTISFEQCLYVILEKAYSIVSGTQNDSRQPLWAPKKYPQKLIKRGFFLQISKWRINKAHLSQIKSYYSLIHWAKGALPRALPPVPPLTPSTNWCLHFFSGCALAYHKGDQLKVRESNAFSFLW